ncbi:MAG: magnesium/cobalt transporter CorA [Chitinophagaceae bacterium]|nr:magnesium/cobalt transporter CorA [Chitinophagaceae bacterium]
MKRKRKHSYRKEQSHKKASGVEPGKVIYIGDDKDQQVNISVIDYDETHFEERTELNIEDCFKYKESTTCTWINVAGIHQTDIIEKIGKHFGINPLVLEDVVNTNSRPKIDDFKDYVFIILKMLTYDTEKRVLRIEQVSLVCGKNLVISFQEDEGDLFNSIRMRLRDAGSRIRKYGPDFLAYSLMDKIVDEYFIIIESMGTELEDMEDEVSGDPTREFLRRYNELKQNGIHLRKSVWPLREVINYLLRGDVWLVKQEVLPYYRDLYDHTIQVIDTTETYRDLFSDIMDIYLSTLSLKMNEVMKVLTIISTIFIPLTFIVGVYGMNFEVMPELKWQYGYYTVWVFMGFVAFGMILYFRRKKWF